MKNKILNNVYININIYIAIFYYILIPIILLISFLNTNDVLLCDNYGTGGWGGELDGRPITSSNSQDYYKYGFGSGWGNAEARPSTSYHSGVDGGYTHYEPYRPGLQSTTEGYRYEMDGQWRYCTDCPNCPHNPNLHHSNSTHSTQLGLIEPTRSEVLGKGYYQGNGWDPRDVYTTKYRSTRSTIWNKIKDDFKKTSYNAHKDSVNSTNKATKLVKDVRSSRIARDVSKLERMNTYNKLNPYKVRRFD